MGAPRKVTFLILSVGLLGSAVVGIANLRRSDPPPAIVARMARRPAWPSPLEGTPPEVREFLGRVLAKLPDSDPPFTGYRFSHWKWADKPTHEAMGIKAIPAPIPIR